MRRVDARALARAAGCALALAGAACGPEPEPRFGATCAADPATLQVTCTVTNHGTKASRACFRARLRPEAGAPIIARRVCTAALGPGQAATATPRFEPIGLRPVAELLAGRCAPAGTWTCQVDILETSREMSQELPREP